MSLYRLGEAEDTSMKDLLLYIAVALSVGNSIMLWKISQPHSLSEAGSEAFFAKGQSLGFSREQLEFFRFGANGPPSSEEGKGL